MDSFVKLCLSMLAIFAFSDVPLISGRLVGDPEMLAAGSTGLIETVAFDMIERGRTTCPVDPNDNRFRTITGRCNNFWNKGASNLPLDRLVSPPAYENGTKGEPRVTGISGFPLPSPRVISQLVHSDLRVTQRLNVLFMQWGQFIDHDVALAPMPTEGGVEIICCGPQNVGVADPLPEVCNPLRFPPHDPDFEGDCMEFVRSEEALEDYGVTPEEKFREQLNAVTAFVDASMVYGSEEELAKELRTNQGKGPFLRAFIDPVQGQLLPKGPFPNCRRPNPEDFCFLAGDIRVNEQPGLATMHTIFLRLHNLIAKFLIKAQPILFDFPEEVYQRARKLVGAITQNILYGEWLPILLGRKAMQRFGLNTGQRSSYVPGVDPSILQEFSTAAYRMGHSLVPSALLAGNTALRLRDHFLLPGIVRKAFRDISEGLVNGTESTFIKESARFEPNQARALDQFVTPELTEHLFEVKPRFGLDLVALNIHRGRDHGLPPYNKVRRACGLSPAESFTDRNFNLSLLEGFYASVEDVDLFVGGLLENRTRGGILGPTFRCIIATQFFRLKFGDRFFFETNQVPEGFPNDQLAAIRNVTMAVVMCVGANLRLVPEKAFRAANNFRNPIMNCDDLKPRFFTMIAAVSA
ncbi:chorion peroxidase-like [Babylonia areolata]|uniref:chorion peroxidase-like n=1 Tax=Babylonia areolata TaxID=304850 RepID=UPI003FD5DE6A